MYQEGIVNLMSLNNKNVFLVVYSKLWTQLTLSHSLNARAPSAKIPPKYYAGDGHD